ncbi:hypothetical protein HK100_011321 [Physocladia obscura]|uniref:Uncharacterized protein n=1 Tax=Physocladia obscura TaxID=109957 RepID=A0AAD5T4B6_9FUNG|nr:hypothetical protein HK100_011321 [Physocladia obscura]
MDIWVNDFSSALPLLSPKTSPSKILSPPFLPPSPPQLSKEQMKLLKLQQKQSELQDMAHMARSISQYKMYNSNFYSVPSSPSFPSGTLLATNTAVYLSPPQPQPLSLSRSGSSGFYPPQTRKSRSVNSNNNNNNNSNYGKKYPAQSPSIISATIPGLNPAAPSFSANSGLNPTAASFGGKPMSRSRAYRPRNNNPQVVINSETTTIF